MPAFAIPLIIQAGEALVIGVIAFAGAMGTSHDFWSAIQVALIAVGAKALPNQIVKMGK